MNLVEGMLLKSRCMSLPGQPRQKGKFASGGCDEKGRGGVKKPKLASWTWTSS